MYDTSDYDGYLWFRLEEVWAAIRAHAVLMRHEWRKGDEPGVCAECEMRLESLLRLVQWWQDEQTRGTRAHP